MTINTETAKNQLFHYTATGLKEFGKDTLRVGVNKGLCS